MSRFSPSSLFLFASSGAATVSPESFGRATPGHPRTSARRVAGTRGEIVQSGSTEILSEVEPCAPAAFFEP